MKNSKTKNLKIFFLIIILFAVFGVVENSNASCLGTLEDGMLFCEDFDNQESALSCMHSGEASVQCGLGSCGEGAFIYASDNYDGEFGYSMNIEYGYDCDGYNTVSNHVFKNDLETTTGEYYISYYYKNLDYSSDDGRAAKFGRSAHSSDSDYNDIHMEWQYFLDNSGTDYYWTFQKKAPDASDYTTYNNQYSIDTDWHHMEQYIKFDSPAGSGNGEFKVWIDDELLIDEFGETMNSSAYPYYDRFYFASNSASYDTYNGQGNWRIDEIEIWDGLPDSSDSIPPSHPTGLSVE